MPIDLDAYFERIGHTGGRAPTLETLAELHRRHAEAIAFENLDPFLRRPVLLDPASLEQKLVRSNRGGYCFEHNLLFRHALDQLGFQVTCLAARVCWNAQPGAITPRGHMLLLVDLDGARHIADVGFGGLTMTGPLHLDTAQPQPTPHEPFRVQPRGREFLLEAEVQREWKALYTFDLQPQHQVDYEVSSWYLSNKPDSHFVTGLIAARPAPGRRYALRHGELTVHQLGGASQRRRLTSVAELREVLEGPFGLTLPDGDDVDARLERLFAHGPG